MSDLRLANEKINHIFELMLETAVGNEPLYFEIVSSYGAPATQAIDLVQRAFLLNEILTENEQLKQALAAQFFDGQVYRVADNLVEASGIAKRHISTSTDGATFDKIYTGPMVIDSHPAPKDSELTAMTQRLDELVTDTPALKY